MLFSRVSYLVHNLKYAKSGSRNETLFSITKSTSNPFHDLKDERKKEKGQVKQERGKGLKKRYCFVGKS